MKEGKKNLHPSPPPPLAPSTIKKSFKRKNLTTPLPPQQSKNKF
jgi:hypothetical protein